MVLSATSDAEREHLSLAVAMLDGDAHQTRLNELERQLKFDPCPTARREARREYLDLTDPKRRAA